MNWTIWKKFQWDINYNTTDFISSIKTDLQSVGHCVKELVCYIWNYPLSIQLYIDLKQNMDMPWSNG